MEVPVDAFIEWKPVYDEDISSNVTKHLLYIRLSIGSTLSKDPASKTVLPLCLPAESTFQDMVTHLETCISTLKQNISSIE